jgi:hypothetical protein
MKKTITKTPKIISQIKVWNPKVYLVGFKFEVGASYDTLRELAFKSIATNGCDLVVTNDKMEMKATQSHICHLFFSDHHYMTHGFINETIEGKEKIAKKLASILSKVAIQKDQVNGIKKIIEQLKEAGTNGLEPKQVHLLIQDLNNLCS